MQNVTLHTKVINISWSQLSEPARDVEGKTLTALFCRERMGARLSQQLLEWITSRPGSMHKLPRKHDRQWLILPQETCHKWSETCTKSICWPRRQSAVSKWSSWRRVPTGSSLSIQHKYTWSLQGYRIQRHGHLIEQPEWEQHWWHQSILWSNSTSHLTSSSVFETNWRVYYSHHLDAMKGPTICNGIKHWLRQEVNKPAQTLKKLQSKLWYIYTL